MFFKVIISLIILLIVCLIGFKSAVVCKIGSNERSWWKDRYIMKALAEESLFTDEFTKIRVLECLILREYKVEDEALRRLLPYLNDKIYDEPIPPLVATYIVLVADNSFLLAVLTSNELEENSIRRIEAKIYQQKELRPILFKKITAMLKDSGYKPKFMLEL